MNYKECARYAKKEGKRAAGVWFRQKILHKFELPYLEVFITTKCNLRCDKCSSLIPDLSDAEHVDRETLFKSIDKLLSNIDRLYRLKLHGGEVFLHPQLADIIEYAGGQKKIKSFRLTTNGTVTPNDEVLEAIKKNNVVVQISDYKLPNAKAADLIERLKTKDIRYAFLDDREWRDMGGFERRTANRRPDCTVARCTSMLGGNIYVCSRAAMMDRRQILQADKVTLFQDKKDFQKAIARLYTSKSSNACLYCDGDTSFATKIPAATQRRREQ
jgi:organic radical activating enzyme